MKSQHSDKEGNVMFGAQDWYAKAGRIPFQDDGFTPELMARIQQAADNQSAGKRIFRSGKSLGTGGTGCNPAARGFGLAVQRIGRGEIHRSGILSIQQQHNC